MRRYFSILVVLAVCAPGIVYSGGEPEETEVVEIEINSWRTEDADAWNNEIIPLFEAENPDIRVKFQPFTAGEYNTILRTGLAGGRAGDVIQLRPGAVFQDLYEAGYLLPLDGEIPRLSDFPEDALEQLTGYESGNVYGVPINQIMTGIFYNVEVFEEHGLEEPETWAEFMDLNDYFLNETDLIPMAATSESWMLGTKHGVFGPNEYGGEEFVGEFMRGETDLTDDPFVRSIQVFQELLPYWPPNISGVGYDDARTMFTEELAAMYPGGSYELATFRDRADFEMGFFVPPAEDGPGVSAAFVGTGFGVNADSPNLEAATRFVAFIASAEFGTAFTDSLLQIPVAPGSEPSDEFVERFFELASTQGAPFLTVQYTQDGTPSGHDLLNDGLQELVLGRIDAEEVAANIQRGIDAWFEPRW